MARPRYSFAAMGQWGQTHENRPRCPPNSNVSRYSGIMVTWLFSAMMVLSTGSSQANAAIFPHHIAATMSL